MPEHTDVTKWRNPAMPAASIVTDWRPGQPVQHNIRNKVKPLPAPDLVQRKVEDALINWFLGEIPRADEVSIVPNSLKLVDANYNVWTAKVQTTMFFTDLEPRIHQSYVRFATQCYKNRLGVGNDLYTINHNHVIFPS
jgi:hypothetical protein